MLLDRFGFRKPHGLFAVERDSRAALLQGLRALNLDVEDLSLLKIPSEPEFERLRESVTN